MMITITMVMITIIGFVVDDIHLMMMMMIIIYMMLRYYLHIYQLLVFYTSYMQYHIY